tara:strand:- start:96 stop:494 length:399 start_codon:yes stop_codon:yes gene_type:complete
MIKIDVDEGEVFDRITILDLKLERISDTSRLDYIKSEKSVLLKALIDENIEIEESLYDTLYEVNSKIWDTEAGLRDKEAKKEFDDQFIEFARLSAKYNDERFVIKTKINEHYNSETREQKSYDSLYETNNSD